MSHIRKAKKEIFATMDVNEELINPLPEKYYSLLGIKYKEGIIIKRIVFGPIKQYKRFFETVIDKNLFFIGKHTKSKNYKRMIMIDNAKLFFGKRENNKEKYYFTTDNKYLDEYKKYFDRFNVHS